MFLTFFLGYDAAFAFKILWSLQLNNLDTAVSQMKQLSIEGKLSHLHGARAHITTGGQYLIALKTAERRVKPRTTAQN